MVDVSRESLGPLQMGDPDSVITVHVLGKYVNLQMFPPTLNVLSSSTSMLDGCLNSS